METEEDIEVKLIWCNSFFFYNLERNQNKVVTPVDLKCQHSTNVSSVGQREKQEENTLNSFKIKCLCCLHFFKAFVLRS